MAYGTFPSIMKDPRAMKKNPIRRAYDNTTTKLKAPHVYSLVLMMLDRIGSKVFAKDQEEEGGASLRLLRRRGSIAI